MDQMKIYRVEQKNEEPVEDVYKRQLICWITTSAPERSARRQSRATNDSSAMEGEP